MDLNKKDFERAYSPYRKEAVYCLARGCVLSVLCSVVLVALGIKGNAIWIFAVFPLYLAVEILVNCKLAILSLIEERKQCVVPKNVLIEGSQREYSASGRWGSVIPALYPKEMKVDRYLIKGTDTSGRKISFRCVMSLKNAILFDEMLECESLRKRTVIIGKYSRVVLKYCDKDDFAVTLSRRI